MWFKNIQLYRLTDPAALDCGRLDEQLRKRSFTQIGTLDRSSAGWVAPAHHAPDLSAYHSAGAYLIALKVEEKILPGSVVKDAAAKRIEEIEAAELRKVGKKEAKEIRERIAEELLPRAFAKAHTTRAMIDPQNGWLWVDASTPAKAELLVQFLRETLGALPAKLPQTQLDPVTAMTTWLEHGAPPKFTLDADSVLKSPGEGSAQAKLTRQDLNSEEVQMHLKAGKLVTSLAMSYDDRVSFVLTEKLQLKRVAMLDLLQDQLKETEAEDAAAMFDATLFLLVEQGRGLVDAVIGVLGGELQ